MGAYINFTNRIHISEKTSYLNNGDLFSIGYDELTEDLIAQVSDNMKIKTVQISDVLPKAAFKRINRLFVSRSDLYFRIFGLWGNALSQFDFSCLDELPNVERYSFDLHLKNSVNNISFDFISKIPNLKGLKLDLFDRYDYSFLNDLSHDLEELYVFADTSGKAIQFDCKWLLQYDKLQTLYLGNKAKKNLNVIGDIKGLRNLYLRGIKVKDFSFLFDLLLDSFHLLWCGNDDLSQLAHLSSLRRIELWRIMKLTNIDFLSQLHELEIIKLQDLKHIEKLPDLSSLEHLKEITAINVPLDKTQMNEQVLSVLKLH